MSKEDVLKHALHNEEAFLHLLPEEKFVDWIINTAFYSALHFVDYKIFPLRVTEKGIHLTIDDIDSYSISILNKSHSDKHTCRVTLVRQKLKEISYEFNWLYSNCKNARYTDYNFSNPTDTCKKAKAYLEAIKKFCYTPKK